MSDIPKEALGCVTEMDEAARKAEFDAFFKTLPEATQILRSTVPEDSETWRRAQIIGNEAPELAPYRDEPIQFKSAGVGKNGFFASENAPRHGRSDDHGRYGAAHTLHHPESPLLG